MGQLKRYNGTNWENVGGNIAPKTVQTTSDTDTYSCNYINNLNTYSTTEKRIGIWTDGKPLYRKCYQITSLPSSNTDLIDISGLSFDSIVKLYGMINTDNHQHFPMPLYDSASNYSVLFTTPTAIRGRGSVGSGTFSNAIIILEYTKTTD